MDMTPLFGLVRVDVEAEIFAAARHAAYEETALPVRRFRKISANFGPFSEDFRTFGSHTEGLPGGAMLIDGGARSIGQRSLARHSCQGQGAWVDGSAGSAGCKSAGRLDSLRH